MYGRRYWGGAYWGARYWGDGGELAPPGATAAQIWAYVLPNGLTAAQNVVDIRAMLLAITTASPPLDVNVQWVNDRLVQGTGEEGDRWGPA